MSKYKKIEKSEKKPLDIIDTIIFSKEFRRLEGKTQLFSISSGNHYRNRLTHTLEVLAISKKIAKEVKQIILENNEYKNQSIDEELIECIALAHDLGHTPFGHTGERTLQDILSRNDSLGGLINNSKNNNNVEIFKHNINSGRILINNFENIDYRVIDGAIKHTYIFYNDFSRNKILNTIASSQFDKKIKEQNLCVPYWQILYPLTIEGQIVSIADEIAQRCADLDDTYRSRYLNKVKNLIDSNKLDVNNDVNKKSQYDIIISNIKEVLINGIKASLNQILKTEKNLNFEKLVNINIINYYGEALHFEFSNEMSNSFKELKKQWKKERDKRIAAINTKSKKDVNDYEKADKLDYDISNIIKVVLDNYDIRFFDLKSKQIIRQLFKAYYNNYKQLSNKEILCLCSDINDYLTNNSCDKYKKLIMELIRFNSREEISNLLNFKTIFYESPKISRTYKNKKVTLRFFKEINQLNISTYNIEWLDFENIDILIDFIKNNYLKCESINKLFNIFLIHIANYIANMTDEYAIAKYHELYGYK